MAKQITKRCHFVPKSYLKSFAADEKRQKIWRFGKSGGNPELKPIDKVAVKHHLYSPFDMNGNRDDAMEKRFAKLEMYFADPVWYDLLDDFPDLGWVPRRKMLCLLIATTLIRNPAQLLQWKGMHSEMVRQIERFVEMPDEVEIAGKTIKIDSSDWLKFRGADENDLLRDWNNQLKSIGSILEILIGMRFSVIFSDFPVFITSDNPVTILQDNPRFLGLKNHGTLILFPLSPKRILVLDHLQGQPENKYYPLKVKASKFNLEIWRKSNEYMFSHRHPDLVCEEFSE